MSADDGRYCKARGDGGYRAERQSHPRAATDEFDLNFVKAVSTRPFTARIDTATDVANEWLRSVPRPQRLEMIHRVQDMHEAMGSIAIDGMKDQSVILG